VIVANPFVEIDANRVRAMRDAGMYWPEIAAAFYTSRQVLWAWRKRIGYQDTHTKAELFKLRKALGMEAP